MVETKFLSLLQFDQVVTVVEINQGMEGRDIKRDISFYLRNK